MKTRLGFVSNSSSSSFIAVAVKFDDSITEEIIDENDLESIDDGDYVGFLVSRCFDEGTSKEIKIEDITTQQKNLKKIFPNKEVKVVFGATYG
jgi:hypothetical protein